MKLRPTTLTLAALVLAASSGCAHRTTSTYRTSDTIRTDTSPQEVAPKPVVEDSTTVIKRSHSTTEGGQQ
jgi:type IV pilus biogenesis protein CpaD/CtpE